MASIRLMIVATLSLGFSMATSAVTLVSSGSDGAFIASASAGLPDRADGRYEFTTFLVDTASILDLSSIPAASTVFLLANGPMIIVGDLLAPGKSVYLASSASISITGQVSANILGLFSNQILGGGSLTITSGMLVAGFNESFELPMDFLNGELLIVSAQVPSAGSLQLGGVTLLKPPPLTITSLDPSLGTPGAFFVTSPNGTVLDNGILGGLVLVANAGGVIDGGVIIVGAVPLPAAGGLLAGALGLLVFGGKNWGPIRV